MRTNVNMTSRKRAGCWRSCNCTVLLSQVANSTAEGDELRRRPAAPRAPKVEWCAVIVHDATAPTAHRMTASIFESQAPSATAETVRTKAVLRLQRTTVSSEPVGLGWHPPPAAALEKRPAASPPIPKPTASLRTCSTACGRQVLSVRNFQW